MASKRTLDQSAALPSAALGRFNLATMSGVFPGTRTQIYQRLHLVRIDPVTGIVMADQRAWLQLLWYAEPAACVGYLFTAAAGQADEPLFQLAEPQRGDFLQRLTSALLAQGWQLRSCATCHFWQRAAATTADQLPLGACSWSGAPTEIAVPPLLINQSGLALDCVQWQLASTTTAVTVADAKITSPLPMRRAAESAEIRLPLWQRLWRRYRRRRDGHQPRLTAADWATKLVERSGVGAGTESCFVCQGRIANLGALTVASTENDKETYSVWRCRHCYTLYLNDWVDRWERLDNLETEESYYRVAPAEALTLLTVIDGVSGGEHPNRRHERQTQRQFFTEFMAQHPVLSHQIRQGR